MEKENQVPEWHIKGIEEHKKRRELNLERFKIELQSASSSTAEKEIFEKAVAVLQTPNLEDNEDVEREALKLSIIKELRSWSNSEDGDLIDKFVEEWAKF